MGLAHGTHGWSDVAVPDLGRGIDFYTGLFGWETTDVGDDVGVQYMMFTLDGDLVAGMSPLPPDTPIAGRTPSWSSYLIVDDAGKTFARAVELGATPLMEPVRIMDAGSMAFLLDPVGASLGLWEAGAHGGAELFNVHNTVTWNDLGCRDVHRAMAFYGDLLGWEFSGVDMGADNTYWMISNAGRMNGGAWDMSGSVPEDTPAHWLTWFRVADCAASAARVTELGGFVRRPPQDTPMGVTTIVADPFGATFGIIETDRADGQPPR